jgi:hypothetical protein
MRDLTEVYSRIEGIVIIKQNGRNYQVQNAKSSSTASNETVLSCLDDKDKPTEIRVSSKSFLEALQGLFSAERETQCKQLLVFDLDAGEWICYPINEKLKEKFPLLKRDKVDYIR